MNILILGANGLIGSTIFRVLSETKDNVVYGTIRNESAVLSVPESCQKNTVSNVDMLDDYVITSILNTYRPHVVVNCAGLTKHRPNSGNPLAALPINSLFPHKLAKLCALMGARVIHISTDCVFSGHKGFYSEEDHPDALELYGISKAIGEVDYPNALTIRTSTIGHEKHSTAGLLEWFLSQQTSCSGYAKAIFSGLPTVTLARVIRDYVLPNDIMTGVYHVAGSPIDKLSLLRLIANVYAKDINVIADDSFVIDRSLNAKKFAKETGYVASSWDVLVREMYDDFRRNT